ncbi:cupin domain-containing protein [Neorhodopirellula lusitana]|uniref:cupin domain-containing protein n=1 Tax=Neorhodopirellula lusitana TaxID=445327 RepID=UPI003851108A
MLKNLHDRSTLSVLRSRGWAGPLPCLTPDHAATLASHVRTLDWKPQAAWSKDLAVRDRWIWDLASSEKILRDVRPLLGEDIILWGSSVVARQPGQAHAWHSDIEVWDAQETDAVSVWIGLEATSQASSLRFIDGSHRAGISVQEAAVDLSSDARTGEALLRLAQARWGDEAALSTADAWDGAMLMFAGGTWHGSLNTQSEGTRVAVLLQFARADFRIRQPDWSQLNWPFRFDDSVQPPVLCVSGDPDIASQAGNRVVSPPSASPRSMWDSSQSLASLRPQVHAWHSPLAIAPGGGWQPTAFFEGYTQGLRKISSHASSLTPGDSPHIPHHHDDEEFLVMLSGEADLHFGAGPDDPSPELVRVKPGDFVFYPAFAEHAISCPDDATEPAQYLMFRWNASAAWGDEVSEPMVRQKPRNINDYYPATGSGFASRLIEEGPTTCLSLLHMHASTVEQGSGYPSHEDEYDVAIVLLEGAVETLGKRVQAPTVLFHPAGTAHGLQAVSESPARYMVLEFHHPADPDLPPPRQVSLLRRHLQDWWQRCRPLQSHRPR